MIRESLPYRKSVGIILLNHKGEALIGKRIDTRVSGWQMPQGGIDDNEDTDIAALRELKEETGVDNVKIITKTKDWYYYDIPDDLIPKFWGGKFRGQKQIWFAMQFLGNDSEINLNYHQPAEFSQWQWTSLTDLPNIVVKFKQQLYIEVLTELQPQINLSL